MIVLMDLNYTLVENSNVKRSPFTKQIEGETYRQWLIDRYRRNRVILITARPVKYREETLAHIRQVTGWRPQEAYFNETWDPPAEAKRKILTKYILPKHKGPFLAIESNPLTRKMYLKFDIPSCRVEGDRVIHC